MTLTPYECACLGGCFYARPGGAACFCSKPLEPIRNADAEQVARENGPQEPRGSSLITTRSDDTNRTPPPAWQQAEPTYSASEVATILTDTVFSVTDATVSTWCRQGK